MRFRKFGRTGWDVSEIGYGMWGMGAWSGSEDAESLGSLQKAIDLGCNFFDTAWVYGNGHSEKLLRQALRANSGKKLFVATKVPPKNQAWPAPANERLKTSGKVRAVGISLNRWEPWNGVKAVRSGLIDSVQVVYNIFDQNPEDELFPACREKNVAVIARVPFDEGALTGALTASSKWADGDWRNSYFSGGKLQETLKRVDALKPLLPESAQDKMANGGMTLPELALRFILSNPDVSTTIPGMRKTRNVEANLAVSERGALSEYASAYLPADLLVELRKHRWDRKL